MRYQQQQARMSPNWREKEAMSTQKLMAATTHLHLKQDEEIIRLRRNVSSLAKKNHGLMRQVHELVSRLRQYPPPRVPRDTRPTNQDEGAQEDPSPEEDTQMKGTAEGDAQTRNTAERENMEYDILPDWAETPTPTPTPPIQQAPPLATPSPTPSPTPTRPTTPAAPETRAKTKKRKGKQTSRSGQTPPTETPLPIKTPPEEEVTVYSPSDKVYIAGQKHWLAQFAQLKLEGYNGWKFSARAKTDKDMTPEGWAWYGPEGGWDNKRILLGGPESSEAYIIEYRVETGALKIGRDTLRAEDRTELEKHNGTYLVGPKGQKLQIVLQ